MTIVEVAAFTQHPDGGNLAGVVYDPPDSLTDADCQALAAQAGYSETVFVRPASDGLHLRYWTPTEEVPLCGHATIAALGWLFQQGHYPAGALRLTTGAGLLKARIEPDGLVWMQQAAPVLGPILHSVEGLCASLGIQPSQLSPALPPQVVSTGLPDLLVPVDSLATLAQLTPDFTRIEALSQALDTVGYHVVCLTPADPIYTAHCRNFAPRLGIPEEAATGTASGAVLAYLVHQGIVPTGELLRFRQGEALQRLSDIFAKMELGPAGVWVAGYACATRQDHGLDPDHNLSHAL